MKLLTKTLSVLVASAAMAGIFSVQAEDSAAVNTAPVGQECMQGQPCAAAVAASAGGAAKTGEMENARLATVIRCWSPRNSIGPACLKITDGPFTLRIDPLIR